MEINLISVFLIAIIAFLLFLLSILILKQRHLKEIVQVLSQEKDRFQKEKKELEVKLEETLQNMNRIITKYVEEYKEKDRRQIEESLKKEYEAKFKEWKIKEEKKIRKDAISKSSSSILGKIGEHLSPLLIFSEYNINPKELRFIGTPIDFIAFKGLEEEDFDNLEVVFIEVKTGKSTRLTKREFAIKRAIENKRVKWITFNTLEALNRYN